MRGHYAGLFVLFVLGWMDQTARAQALPGPEQPVALTLEGDNYVIYRNNVFDVTKLAKDPNITTSAQTAFLSFVNVGDVRSINGDAVKGLLSSQGPIAMPYRANPTAGQPIADLDGGGMLHCVWQILSADGKPIGTIVDVGIVGADHVIVGGTGAFQGVTGLHLAQVQTTPQRQASATEDPAKRRINGGGKFRTVFYLYPKGRPAVLRSLKEPAVYHADGTPVTVIAPAQANETLTLYASGLGPVTPAVAFGQPFPEGAAVNAAVEVTVNGNAAQVVSASGDPGAVDRYQVQFQLPGNVGPGPAMVRLTAAWIPGPAVVIAVK